MSNILAILDALSKLTEGELSVLGEALQLVKKDTTQALNQSALAVQWSQYALKSQKFPAPIKIIDPNTLLPIVQPDFQKVDDYPIIFGQADTVSGKTIPNRSTTFAFGAKAFLGYANDANGNPYSDTSYSGGTVTNLGEIEVVNYRTLVNAIQGNQTIAANTYLLKAGDETDNPSTHTFGAMFLRGNSEKVYYNKPSVTTDTTTVGYDPSQYYTITPLTPNTIGNSTTPLTYYSILPELEVATMGDLHKLGRDITGGTGSGLDGKYDKTGGLISGDVQVSGNLSLDHQATAPHHAVRFDQMSTGGSLGIPIPAPTLPADKYKVVSLISGVPAWAYVLDGTKELRATIQTIVCRLFFELNTYSGGVPAFSIGTPDGSSVFDIITGQRGFCTGILIGSEADYYYWTESLNEGMMWQGIKCNSGGDYRITDGFTVHDYGITAPGTFDPDNNSVDMRRNSQLVSSGSKFNTVNLQAGHYYVIAKQMSELIYYSDTGNVFGVRPKGIYHNPVECGIYSVTE